METNKSAINEKIVNLGERAYKLRPLAIRRAREVRARIKGPLQTVIDALKSAPDIELTDTGALGGLLDAVGVVLLDSLDLMLEVILAYSPEIRDDTEYILDNAVDSQVMSAFLEVIQFLYPFGQVFSLITSLSELATTMKSQSANGEDGATN